MKDLLEICAGLDVHKEKIVACVLSGPLGKPTHTEIMEFSTLLPDMVALRNWIVIILLWKAPASIGSLSMKSSKTHFPETLHCLL